MNPKQIQLTKTEIIQKASKAHQRWPQYNGYWDGPEWKLAKVVSLKGLRARARRTWYLGQITVVRPEKLESEPCLLAYNEEDERNCLVPETMFQLLE